MPIPNQKFTVISVDKAGRVIRREVNLSEVKALLAFMPGPSLSISLEIISIPGMLGCTGACEVLSQILYKRAEGHWAEHVKSSIDISKYIFYVVVGGESASKIFDVCEFKGPRFAGLNFLCDPSFILAKALTDHLYAEPTTKLDRKYYKRLFVETNGPEILTIKKSEAMDPSAVAKETVAFIQEKLAEEQAAVRSHSAAAGVAAGVAVRR